MQTAVDLFGNSYAVKVKSKPLPGNASSVPPSIQPIPYTDRCPVMAIHPSKICLYSEVNSNQPRRRAMVLNDTGQLVDAASLRIVNSARKANGNISVNAQRKMLKALDYLLFLANEKVVDIRNSGRILNFKVAFVTLTLPSSQVHDDKEIINKCLNPLLLELKSRYSVSNYLWRAEKQLNGNIHFHLLVDKFIPWSELRDRWNRIVNRIGYVDRYRDEMKEFHRAGFRVREKLLAKWDYKSQIKAYQKGKLNDWSSPNSTDIHSIRKIKNVKAYVTKYMTKPPKLDHETGELFDSEIKQTGRVWGCNHELSNVQGAQIYVDWSVSDIMTEICMQNSVHFYKGDYFSCYYLSASDLVRLGASDIIEYFFSYLRDHFHLPGTQSFLSFN